MDEHWRGKAPTDRMNAPCPNRSSVLRPLFRSAALKDLHPAPGLFPKARAAIPDVASPPDPGLYGEQSCHILVAFHQEGAAGSPTDPHRALDCTRQASNKNDLSFY